MQTAEAWVVSVGRQIDLRILLAGALLPDLDKLIGRLAFGTFGVRAYCHTLLFLLVIASAGLCLYVIRRKNWALVLAFGVLMHLLLDMMWLEPRVLLWPFLGLSFPPPDGSEWLRDILYRLVTWPSVYVPEVLGIAILACFVSLLARRGTLQTFLRHGQV